MSLPFYMRAPNKTPNLKNVNGNYVMETGKLENRGYTHCFDDDPKRDHFSREDVPAHIRISDGRRQK